ncbi:MAG: kynureninase [Alphaproteobacteria bacterium]|nr:kynureninase [Alphaproteobacteria bacterium]MBU0803381.1 kynureninase [Alphaproteobacteria bacterium]MBU0871917.1 kynureninase [Alphaproteobacteria bacterium]MBU1402310.1 kynureninase [Alphaproteobacteria bacterium]MBU1590955.1 kynureninase [Alphaproteobacteria bacterium]
MTDFASTRALFHTPEGVIYLDGNSLGPLPLAAKARVADMIEKEWGEHLIRGWNVAGWMHQPRRIGDRIGRLIGAAEGTVVMGDTLSIKVYQALASALDLNPARRVVLSDSGNFPSDLYMAQGLLQSFGRGLELKVVEPEAVEAAIDDSVAVLMLTEVDYRTGRLHDMKALTKKAHAHGALTVWDLAHSAGALPVDLAGADADFAVGCTYKYLNGGPGAPAFIYVAPRHAETARPALSGWMGHAAPFAFDLDYRAGQGIERMRVGTPPVIALAALDAALDAWDGVSMDDVRAASTALCDLFIAEVEARCPELVLATTRDGFARGSQVSFRHPEGYAIMQALIARGVIGDFRAPDNIRFGLTPLYIGEAEVRGAVEILGDIMANRLWDRPEYRRRAAVT